MTTSLCGGREVRASEVESLAGIPSEAREPDSVGPALAVSCVDTKTRYSHSVIFLIGVLLLANAACTVWLVVQVYRIKATLDIESEMSQHIYDEAHTAAARGKSILEFIYGLKPTASHDDEQTEQKSPLIPLTELREQLSAAQPERYKSELEPLLDQLQATHGELVSAAAVEELIAAKLRELERQRQEIVDREAKKGKTIEIAALRQRMEATKAACAGSNRDAYANELDRLLDGLSAKYGSSIPVDEACRIMQKLERGMYSEED